MFNENDSGMEVKLRCVVCCLACKFRHEEESQLVNEKKFLNLNSALS